MAVAVQRHEILSVHSDMDIVRVRQAARAWARELGFNLVDQTKIVTAASELARNTVDWGGGGTARLEILDDGRRQGLRVILEDHGPGISDIELALQDGYTTGTGLGLGLSGSRRLMDEFEIASRVGEGTRVSITRWK